ncbi:Bacteriophytochrome [Pyrenophora teres f. maculata]|nr:Bacteriophytochrome [Pyrenophora teres f. maculata]
MSQSPYQTPDAGPPAQDGHRYAFSTVSPVQEETCSPLDAAAKPPYSTSPPPKSANTGPTTPVGPLSPSVTDRVFPIRSAISVDPTPTPKGTQSQGDYFHPYSRANDPRLTSDSRRASQGSATSQSSHASQRAWPIRHSASKADPGRGNGSRRATPQLPPAQLFNDISSTRSTGTGSVQGDSRSPSFKVDRPPSLSAASAKSGISSLDMGGLVAHRFKHVVTDGGHMVITGREGDTLQRCEDEPIHIPGAIQGFGLLVALQDDLEGSLLVRIVSENSRRILGRTPKELFALESFTDILSEEQADNLLDHIDFIKDEDSDVTSNGPEVFTMSIKVAGHSRTRKLWCAIHINETNPGLVICEFELEEDPLYPLVPPNDLTPELPEDTLSSQPTAEELLESTEVKSKPLRVLRSARKRKGEAAAMEVFNIMSQVQEQLAAAPSLEKFLKVLVGVVKELTGFHRVMIYQFDQTFNGRVVTELVDPRATKDLYKGLNFPASDIPKQARELYKLNKVRMLYDRDQQTARLVCRTAEDLETPLDLTHSYLRAMSPIHLKYLNNMAVRSSMSISINAFSELWGLIACHSYGPRGMRVSFPIRKMCRMVGDAASRNIERLSYASRLQARKLINTVPTQHNPSGYIIASSDDLLKLFDADFGLLSIRDETKILGTLENSQEALAMLEYLRMRKIQAVMTSTDIVVDFPDLRYPPGFHVIAGMLIVPLSVDGEDFIVFFRKGQLKEVKWAGNPYEKFIKEGTEGYLEPRKSFKTWSETVVGKCREWTEEEIETASVLCLVYGKFIEVWRQKEAALQSSQLTRLLLANSAHEVRTPLNAIINYLEIALEGALDTETRENLSRSHSASKSLIYVINDLLDLVSPPPQNARDRRSRNSQTKTEEGGPLIKGESFDFQETIKEATDMFRNDAKRKSIKYEVIEHPGLPKNCIGDQRRIRQAISNITANAIQNTTQGTVKVEIYVAGQPSVDHVDVEVAVSDTGVGMSQKKLDQLFFDLEQVHSEPTSMIEDALLPDQKQNAKQGEKATLGLGLAIVARIIRNMNGQLRLRSEEGKGTRFVIQFPFDLPDSEIQGMSAIGASPSGSITPQPNKSFHDVPGSSNGERTLIAPSLSRHASDSENKDQRDQTHQPVARRSSAESLTGRSSLRSFKSGSSQRSDVDRLIDAIQEPHMVGRGEMSPSARSMRPTLTKRNSLDPDSAALPKRSKSLEYISTQSIVPPHQRSMKSGGPGEENIFGSNAPVTALKMPDEGGNSPIGLRRNGSILGEVEKESPTGLTPQTQPTQPTDATQPSPEPANLSPNNMRVLVAEDDPVNSRIVKKRLEKLGHMVHLTVNGEECSSAFCDNSQDTDIILMDMQMPIVDGLTSTKMIRSFEKLHQNIYSPRAAICGRVPIIAVSASLIERDRQQYIDAGFDAWILKPISFDRLNKLMTAVVDKEIRSDCLYQPGAWEKGGWFHTGKHSAGEVDTKPSGEAPVTNPSEEMEEAIIRDDDPMAGEKNEEGDIPEEQERLLQNQAEGKTEPPEDSAEKPPA